MSCADFVLGEFKEIIAIGGILFTHQKLTTFAVGSQQKGVPLSPKRQRLP